MQFDFARKIEDNKASENSAASSANGAGKIFFFLYEIFRRSSRGSDILESYLDHIGVPHLLRRSHRFDGMLIKFRMIERVKGLLPSES